MSDYPNILTNTPTDIRLMMRNLALRISETPFPPSWFDVFITTYVEECDTNDEQVKTNWMAANGERPMPNKLYGFLQSSFNSLITWTILPDGTLNNDILNQWQHARQFSLTLGNYRILTALASIGGALEKTLNEVWKHKPITQDEMTLMQAIEDASIRCHTAFGKPLLSSATFQNDPLFIHVLDYPGNQPNKNSLTNNGILTDPNFGFWYCSFFKLLRNYVAHNLSSVDELAKLAALLPQWKYAWLFHLSQSHPRFAFFKQFLY